VEATFGARNFTGLASDTRQFTTTNKQQKKVSNV
jgi:hypothetical protein